MEDLDKKVVSRIQFGWGLGQEGDTKVLQEEKKGTTRAQVNKD